MRHADRILQGGPALIDRGKQVGSALLGFGRTTSNSATAGSARRPPTAPRTSSSCEGAARPRSAGRDKDGIAIVTTTRCTIGLPQRLRHLRDRDRPRYRRAGRSPAMLRSRRRPLQQSADRAWPDHGGIVQGHRQALGEQLSISSPTRAAAHRSLMDYGLPRADTVPSFTNRRSPRCFRHQPARHQGGRRRRHHRRAGGRRQRDRDALATTACAISRCRQALTI